MKQPNMTIQRFTRLEDLLKLAFDMQSSADGVSLQDIQGNFSVSRRTAEHMRDSVYNIFPVEEVDTGERVKRWRIPSGSLNPLIHFSAEELSELKRAIDIFQRDNIPEDAKNLHMISSKISALIKPNKKPQITTDLEALIDAEGIALRAGPRPKINDEIILILRQAIISCKQCRISYLSRSTGKTSKQLVYPYGFIFGHRHYLLAYNTYQEDYRYYSLANIKKVTETDDYFTRYDDFSLNKYMQNSFGVFQEKPSEIHLRFTHDVASDVLEYQFHPSQKIIQNYDRSVDVTFTAGGQLAICWHLFTWGEYVQIIAPESLKKQYKKLLEKALTGL